MSTIASRPPSTIPAGCDSVEGLQAAPIPDRDIRAGSPQARSREVCVVGEGLSVWVWDCTAGTFDWHFDKTDEIVHIVEGSATVTQRSGAVLLLEAGDVSVFEAGTTLTWEVEEYVRKVAVTRVLADDPLSRLVRALRRFAKQLLRR